MTDPITWKTIISVAVASDKIIDAEKRNKIIKFLKLLIQKNKKILVFGISGAGKTQFTYNLKNNLKIAERTNSTNKIRFNVEDIPIIFIDTPGQELRAFARKEEVRQVLKNKIEGIINVVSYGFEENPEIKTEDIFTRNSRIKKSFLNLNRKAELKRLNEWLPQIQPKDVRWILNLVNKADLWSDDINDVYKYYNSGRFKDNFKHHNEFMNIITLPYCSIIKPYYGTQNSQNFGEIEKNRLHTNFMNQFYQLLK